MKNIGINIKKIRELRGLSRIQLADKLNITERGYGKIENGEVGITLDRLQKISDMLDIDPLQLLEFDEKYIFNNCTKNTSVLNNGTINNLQSEALIQSLNDLIFSLKEQINAKDELIQFLKNSKE